MDIGKALLFVLLIVVVFLGIFVYKFFKTFRCPGNKKKKMDDFAEEKAIAKEYAAKATKGAKSWIGKIVVGAMEKVKGKIVAGMEKDNSESEKKEPVWPVDTCDEEQQRERVSEERRAPQFRPSAGVRNGQRTTTDGSRDDRIEFDINDYNKSKENKGESRAPEARSKGEKVDRWNVPVEETTKPAIGNPIAELTFCRPGMGLGKKYSIRISAEQLPVLVGRDARNDGTYGSVLSIPACVDSSVSAEQFCISLSEDRHLIITDLNSEHGTRLDNFILYGGNRESTTMNSFETEASVGKNGSYVVIRLFDDICNVVREDFGYHVVLDVDCLIQKYDKMVTLERGFEWYSSCIIGRRTFVDDSHEVNCESEYISPVNAVCLEYIDGKFFASVTSNTLMTIEGEKKKKRSIPLEEGTQFWIGRLRLTVVGLCKDRVE